MALESLEIGLYSHRLTNSLLQQLEFALRKFEATQDSDYDLGPPARALKRIHRRLQRPLRVAIIGELNAGKTTLSNMLIGNVMLPTRAVSNTRFPTLIRYSTDAGITAVSLAQQRHEVEINELQALTGAAYLDVGMPIKHLRYLEIMDFPSLSMMDQDNYHLNLSLHNIDAVIWCTPAIGAWKKSELDAWLMLPERLRNRALLVVNQIDQLDDKSRKKVLLRLQYELETVFHNIVMVSSTQGLKALKTPGEEAASRWGQSGGEELEQKLQELLTLICDERANAAMYVTKRIARRVLSNFRNYFRELKT